jgi:hypothetical protein
MSEVFGIECRHHYGITTHDLVDGEPAADTVYRLMREVWHQERGGGRGLRDDNHTWEAVEAEKSDWFSRIRIIKNAKSPYFLLNPYRMPDGPGAFWFDQEYRIATRGLIEREAAEALDWADKWEADAARQRDTIRGRKARAKYLSWAQSKRREAELIASRWPQFAGSDRTGWQNRLHNPKPRIAA